MAQINKSSFDFLNKLAANNNRDWFAENKPWYQDEHENAIVFAEAMLQGLKEHDEITTLSGKKSLMRVYRDVRFSKDKSPYNPRWAGGFNRQKPHLRGGYYFQVKPGHTVVGGGFYGPVSEDLKLIRDHIAQDDKPLRSVLNEPNFKKVFGELQGDQVKTAPKGFDKEHPAIDLLRYKSMYVFRSFTDKEVLSPSFMKEALSTFVALRPFFDVMTEMLSTDLNGLSLFEE